jgi:hypothetical protein
VPGIDVTEQAQSASKGTAAIRGGRVVKVVVAVQVQSMIEMHLSPRSQFCSVNTTTPNHLLQVALQTLKESYFVVWHFYAFYFTHNVEETGAAHSVCNLRVLFVRYGPRYSAGKFKKIEIR